MLVSAGGPSAQSLSDLENSVNCVCYQCKEARRKNMEYGEKIHGCHGEVVGVRGADRKTWMEAEDSEKKKKKKKNYSLAAIQRL